MIKKYERGNGILLWDEESNKKVSIFTELYPSMSIGNTAGIDNFSVRDVDKDANSYEIFIFEYVLKHSTDKEQRFSLPLIRKEFEKTFDNVVNDYYI